MDRLQPLTALAGMVVDVRVVTAGGDGIVVSVEGRGRSGGVVEAGKLIAEQYSNNQ